MQMRWRKSKQAQLNLLDAGLEPSTPERVEQSCARETGGPPATVAFAPAEHAAHSADARPMFVAVSVLYEDADNPRTEFPDAEIDELANDIPLIRMPR